MWMAPEVVQSYASMSKSQLAYRPAPADVWSCGVVACEVLQVGRPPWPPFDNEMQAMFA
eukprot:gene17048-21933_t